MSLQILQQPESIALSRNPVLFRFRAEDDSGQPYGGLGVSASVRTNVNGFEAGDTLEITITEPDTTSQILTFTAVATPAAPEEIQAMPYAPTGLPYFELVASQLQSHPVIAPFFIVSTSTDAGFFTITLTARSLEEGWAIEIDASGVSAGSLPTTDQIDQVTPDNTPDNYKILFDVFFEPDYLSGNFERVAQLEGIPDASSQLSFSVSDILDHELRASLAELPIPRFNSTELFKADNLRRYYVRFREDYEGIFDGLSGVAWYQLPVSQILCGGIGQNFFEDYDFFAELGKENSLLSWYPDGKKVGADQPEYLAWINYTGQPLNIALVVSSYGENGLIVSSNYYDDSTLELQPWETVVVPVGYDQLALNDPNVLKYAVLIADQSKLGTVDQAISGVRNFYVDHAHQEDLRYLMYLNSFCVPQTLRCTGAWTHELKVDREESQSIAPDQAGTRGRTGQYDFSFEDLFTYRSGYLGRYEVEALSELLIYNQAFEIYEQGYIALNIKSKNFTLSESDQYLHAIEFKAEPRLKRSSYSNIILPLSAGQQAEGWRVFPDQFWRTAFGQTWKIN